MINDYPPEEVGVRFETAEAAELLDIYLREWTD